MIHRKREGRRGEVEEGRMEPEKEEQWIDREKGKTRRKEDEKEKEEVRREA